MERISAKLLFNTELILYRSRVHDDVIMCSWCPYTIHLWWSTTTGPVYWWSRLLDWYSSTV